MKEALVLHGGRLHERGFWWGGGAAESLKVTESLWASAMVSSYILVLLFYLLYKVINIFNLNLYFNYDKNIKDIILRVQYI